VCGEDRSEIEVSGGRVNCEKCGSTLVRKPNMFFWRGTWFQGLVCEVCNSLWDDPEDSFIAHITSTELAQSPKTDSPSEAK